MSSPLNIVCPHCGAINRVPAERFSDKPVCGKCKKRLFEQHPLELSSANFERHLSRNDIPVLVDFWAPWCGPCKAMAPAYEQAAGSLEPNVRVAKLNTENEQALAGQYGIRGIPTLILFLKGRELARQSGAQSATDIVRWVQSHT